MRGRAHGFTLVEMLVALALVSLMSVAMLQAYRFSQRALVQTTRVEADARDVAGAQRLVRRLVEQAYPFQVSASASSGSGQAFQGQPHALALSAPASAHAGGMGLYRYALGVDESGALHVKWHLDRNGNPEAAPARSEVLLESVEEISVSYLELIRRGNGQIELHWRDDWIDKSGMPALVRIRVAFAAGDRRQWPELLVAPRLSADANCVFDVVSRMCRIAS